MVPSAKSSTAWRMWPRWMRGRGRRSLLVWGFVPSSWIQLTACLLVALDLRGALRNFLQWKDFSSGQNVITSGRLLVALVFRHLAGSVQAGSGKVRHQGAKFPTFMKSIRRQRPPPAPAGFHRAAPETLRRWREDEFRFPPYQYASQFMVSHPTLGQRPLDASRAGVTVGIWCRPHKNLHVGLGG